MGGNERSRVVPASEASDEDRSDPRPVERPGAFKAVLPVAVLFGNELKTFEIPPVPPNYSGDSIRASNRARSSSRTWLPNASSSAGTA